MIYVTGAGGMLGNAICEELERRKIEGIGLKHEALDIAYYWEVNSMLRLRATDVVINCAGVRPGPTVDAIEMTLTNTVGPHVLARVCAEADARLYHISTDCVFSAKRWDHEPSMNSILTTPQPEDMYGRTKLAGEVVGHPCTTIRTSFVGPQHGLWRWIADQQQGASIEVWYKAYWSGSTVWEVASRILDIVEAGNTHGVVHLATAEPTVKALAVNAICKRIGRDDIVLMPGGPRVDRSLKPTSGHELLPFKEALAAWNG